MNLTSPIPYTLSEADTARLPLKVESIRRRLERDIWQETRVEAPPGIKPGNQKKTTLTLTRDGTTFALDPKAAHLFFVAYGDSGLEVIHVEETLWKVPEAEKSKRELCRKSSTKMKPEWCVKYNRVMSTEHAMEVSTKGDFKMGTGGVGRPILRSLGKSSLQKLLDEQAKAQLDRLTFHKGDYPFEIAVKNIVGFVAWDALPSGRAYSAEDRKQLLGKVNSALSKGSQQKLVTISSMDEIDWVFCGPDFSEDTDLLS